MEAGVRCRQSRGRIHSCGRVPCCAGVLTRQAPHGKEELLKNTMKLRSGATIPQITPAEAERKSYLTRGILNRMHLMPAGDPIAYDENADGSITYFFDPGRVVEALPELWYAPAQTTGETMTLENGRQIARMSTKRAAACGYYTKERLSQMNYDVIEEPVAYTLRNDKTTIYFYDKKTAVRRPLMCVECGKDVRYRRKLCRACFEADLAVRRAEGDAHRAEAYHMKRERVLFFDLELTGVYNHDEILSVSIVDGTGRIIMDTLVKPVHKKKWKRTEKIHGITPEMVQDAPHLSDLVPRIKEIFENADILIAYGISTDYSHIKEIYDTEEEREALHRKARSTGRHAVPQTSSSASSPSIIPTWSTHRSATPWSVWRSRGTAWRIPRSPIPLAAQRSGKSFSPTITRIEREALWIVFLDWIRSRRTMRTPPF